VIHEASKGERKYSGKSKWPEEGVKKQVDPPSTTHKGSGKGSGSRDSDQNTRPLEGPEGDVARVNGRGRRK